MSEFFEKKRNRVLFYLVVSIFLFVYALKNRLGIANFFAWVNKVIFPVILGLVFAYVFNALLRFIETTIFERWHYGHGKRVICMIITYLIVFAILGAILIGLVPQLFSNLYDFIRGFEIYLSSAIDYVNEFFAYINSIINPADPTAPLSYLDYDEIMTSVTDYLTSQEIDIDLVLSVLGSDAVSSLTGLLGGTIDVLTTTLFAFFISLYLLGTKEKRYAQINRFRQAFFNDKINKDIDYACERFDKNFGGYFKKKVLDALALSVDLFICYYLIGTPYAFLTVFIIFLGNLIPILGPIIATIIASLFVLIANPDGFFLFLIFTVGMQLLNSYIISPLVFKTTNGLSFLFTLFAIVVFGSFFGVIGIVLAIPLCHTITDVLTKWIKALTIKKDGENSENELKTMDVLPIGNATDMPKPARMIRHGILLRRRKRRLKKMEQQQEMEQEETLEQQDDVVEVSEVSKNSENK